MKKAKKSNGGYVKINIQPPHISVVTKVEGGVEKEYCNLVGCICGIIDMVQFVGPPFVRVIVCNSPNYSPLELDEEFPHPIWIQEECTVSWDVAKKRPK